MQFAWHHKMDLHWSLNSSWCLRHVQEKFECDYTNCYMQIGKQSTYDKYSWLATAPFFYMLTAPWHDPMLSHRFHHASWWTMNVVNSKYPNRGLVSGPWCQRKNEDKCKPLQPLKQQPQTITQPLGKYMPATLHKFCFFAPCHFWTTSCDQQRIGVHQFIPICLNHVECRIHICHV